jgi:hypothetical protein
MRPFYGEGWSREVWTEWTGVFLFLQWERPIEDDWDDFRAEWFRALFAHGKEAGFVV